jgi:multiple antibiotic resistance protein
MWTGFVKTLVSLFVIVDPIAVVPLFLAMTADDTPAQRTKMAARAAAVAGVTLSVFAILGDGLFAFLGISIGAFRIAGGVLLFLLAVDMLRAKPSRQRTTPEETAEGVHKPDVSVFPLGIPMLAGPGSITVVMMERAAAGGLVAHAAVFVAIALVAAVSFAALATATRIERALGRTGMNVLHRVLGLLLAAIAAQLVVDGVVDAFALRRTGP